jgi:hypothetical protein
MHFEFGDGLGEYKNRDRIKGCSGCVNGETSTFHTKVGHCGQDHIDQRESQAKLMVHNLSNLLFHLR